MENTIPPTVARKASIIPMTSFVLTKRRQRIGCIIKNSESEGTVYHPTQKPVELGRYLIRTYSRPGDVILDNACGSCTFLIAALLEGCHFIGIGKNQNVFYKKDQLIDLVSACRKRIQQTWTGIQP